MMTSLTAGGQTHRGHVRTDNQDVILVEPDLGLYAVLDGMGGANAGDVAARLASEKIAAFVREKVGIRRRSPRQLLELALDAAAVEVYSASETQLAYRGMGTTAVACLVIDPSRVVIAHAGDSRACLLRDGQLTTLTRDHTVAQRMVDDGIVSADDIGAPRFLEFHHTLTKNLGGAYGVVPDLVEQTILPGDRLLLCSDGLHGGAAEGAIRRVLASREPPERIAHQLITLALHGRASDNISAIVITVEECGAYATPLPQSRARARRPSASGRRRARP